MFLKCHVELVLEFDVVRAAMLRRPDAWLDGLAEAADRDRVQLLAGCRLEVAARCPARLDVGPPFTTDRLTSLPLRFQAGEPPGCVEGSLDASWLGPGRTYLALLASYPARGAREWPPVDRALLHRIEETVASRFVHAAARRLTLGAAGDQSRGTCAVSSPTGASKWRTRPRADLGTTNPTTARMCSDGPRRSCGSPLDSPPSTGP